MSDQVPSANLTRSHAQFTFATCQLLLNQVYASLAIGGNDNLMLVETGKDNVTEPGGFIRFQTSGGAASVSGMVPNNQFFPDHDVVLLCRVDGPDVVTFLNENAGSLPQNRFIIGADTPLAAGTFVIFVYLPDFQRWGLLFHS